MPSEIQTAKDSVYEITLRLFEDGMIPGSSGNVSARIGEGNLFAITPTSIPYHLLKATDIVVVNESGEVVDGEKLPSHEVSIHLAVYKARKEIGAVLHTHASYSATLSVLRIPIPMLLDEVAVYVGGNVEVAPYGAPGSDDLAKKVVKALGSRGAILLSNHGNLIADRTPQEAYRTAHTVERAAQVYSQALATGREIHLPPDDVIKAETDLYFRKS